MADASTPANRSDVLVEEEGGTDHPLTSRDPRPERFGDQPVVTMPSGFAIPALGMGTWQLEGADLRAALGTALEIGVRHVDTAQMYGNEADVGDVIAESPIDRDELFITTKVANENHEPDRMVASVEQSLERLGVDHVDLLLVHWPVDVERLNATLTTLAQLQAGGIAHHVGVSNFTLDQLDHAADFAPIEVVQCECHPFLQQVELRDFAVERGWAFTAYSPLARGDVVSDELLGEIADAHDVTSSAIALAWLVSQPQVNSIPKSSDPDHVKDNWAAIDVELDDRELEHIATLDQGRRLVDPEFAPW